MIYLQAEWCSEGEGYGSSENRLLLGRDAMVREELRGKGCLTWLLIIGRWYLMLLFSFVYSGLHTGQDFQASLSPTSLCYPLIP